MHRVLYDAKNWKESTTDVTGSFTTRHAANAGCLALLSVLQKDMSAHDTVPWPFESPTCQNLQTWESNFRCALSPA